MAIEQEQFHFNSSFTEYVPTTITNDNVFPTDFLESLLTQQSFIPDNAFPVRKQESRFQPVTGRVTKRKSRATKRATTTFITTDVSNFRQMVQQVTGARVASDVPMVVKPETSYHANTMTPFMLDESFYVNGLVQQQETVLVDNNGQVGDFGFCSFPTLESWKV